jgi:hypothetical protein
MKITDTNVIKNGERDLIETVINSLDLNTVKKIIQAKVNAQTITSKGGKIIVHNNEIAFKLNFSIEINGDLMFDRQGNYLPDSDNDIIHLKKPIQKPIQKKLDPEDNLDIKPKAHDYSDEHDTQLKLDDEPELGYQQRSVPEPEPEIELNLEPDSSDDGIGLIDNEINDDDDINDILEDSLDFWELKKDK